MQKPKPPPTPIPSNGQAREVPRNDGEAWIRAALFIGLASVLVWAGCCSGPGLDRIDATIGLTDVENRSGRELWPNLPEYLTALRADIIAAEFCDAATDEELQGYGFDVSIRVAPASSLVPHPGGLLASGQYWIESNLIDLRWEEDINETALAHEIVHHWIAKRCLGLEDANFHHARPELEVFVQAFVAVWGMRHGGTKQCETEN